MCDHYAWFVRLEVALFQGLTSVRGGGAAPVIPWNKARIEVEATPK